MNDSTFYHLQSKTMSPCTLTKAASAEAKQSWLCTGCCTPKPGLGSIDVHLKESEPDDAPLNFVFGCGVPLVSRALLEEIGMNVIRRDLYLGRVFGPDGRENKDWLTFRGRHRLILRGSKHVSFRCCSDCGRPVYFAMGKRYLFPDPPSDAHVFESHLFGLVITDELFTQLDAGKWRKVSVDKLPVVKAAKDSLGTLDCCPGPADVS